MYCANAAPSPLAPPVTIATTSDRFGFVCISTTSFRLLFVSGPAGQPAAVSKRSSSAFAPSSSSQGSSTRFGSACTPTSTHSP
ncbi:hypothetical protein EB73_10195 [Mycobacterium sp. SWH-M3]|nr:hypothetical protein EB73_10195 [Mycobacterium sp. SWH-M3]